jgi:hypothetical protein
MSLIEINRYPKRNELRNFAMIALIASVIVASLLYLLKGVRIQWAVIIFAAGFGIFLSIIGGLLFFTAHTAGTSLSPARS